MSDSLLFNSAFKEFAQNDLVEAESLLLLHYQSYPNSHYGIKRLYLLGEIAFRRELYGKAIEYFDSLTACHVDSGYCLLSTIRAGDAYANLKDYASALSRYEFAKEFHPDRDTHNLIELKIHEVHFHLGDYNNLVEALRHFVDTSIDTTRTGGIVAKTLLRIARLHAENREHHSALSLLERLVSNYPESPVIAEAFAEKANLHKIIGDYNSYKKVLLLLSTNGENAELSLSAVIELARFYCNEQKYDSSLHYWLLLKENAGYRDLSLLEIARVYDQIGRYGEAIAVIQSLINEMPQSRYVSDAYMLWISILKKQNDYEHAIAILQNLAVGKNENPEILMELGDLYFENKDYLMVVQSYLAASEAFREKRDESARALIFAGDAACAAGNKSGARQYYTSARLIALSDEVKKLALKKISSLE